MIKKPKLPCNLIIFGGNQCHDKIQNSHIVLQLFVAMRWRHICPRAPICAGLVAHHSYIK